MVCGAAGAVGGRDMGEPGGARESVGRAGLHGEDAWWRAERPLPADTAIGGAHAPSWHGSGMERWWFTTCLDDGTSEFGLVVSFARHGTPSAIGEPLGSHAVVWHLSDRQGRRTRSESWLDQGWVDLLGSLTRSDRMMDPRIRQALLEELSQGRLLRPDRMLPGPARRGPDGLDLDWGGVARLREDGTGALVVEADGEHTGFRLRIVPGRRSRHRSPVLRDTAPRPGGRTPTASHGSMSRARCATATDRKA